MLPADSPFASLSAPGPHPATAELRAYAAGTLALAGQHRIETHTLDCARCADLLAGFSLTDTVTTDQAVATLRARLQASTGRGPSGSRRPPRGHRRPAAGRGRRWRLDLGTPRNNHARRYRPPRNRPIS